MKQYQMIHAIENIFLMDISVQQVNRVFVSFPIALSM
jgi:hypothetical protein